MMGHTIHPEEPLMTAGLDSRGGMELRRSLGESLGLDLPVTLLYDYQSISAITSYISELVDSQASEVLDSSEADGVWGEEEEGSSGVGEPRAVKKKAEASANQPSKLLKTLR